MKKQNVFTAMGIVLSLAIALGGWLLVSRMIDMRSDALMSAAGTSPIAMPLQLPNETRPVLSEQEIASIVRNWEAGGRSIPHEPTPEQITMEQAIATAENWLSFIGEQLNLPDGWTQPDFDDTRSISAHLSQNEQPGSHALLPPEYSFWTVGFSNQLMSAVMIINAVEGQVWKTNIQLESAFALEIRREDVSNALTAFVESVGIEDHSEERADVFEGVGFTAVTTFRNFANESAYAAIRIDGVPLDWDSEQWSVQRFYVHLGTHYQLVIAPPLVAPP